ncbi:MAG TPA: hypothetical protein VJ023_07290, partial [Pyrinomonadaceae bacterium]|nr:hypothetical protein [Pyrinomonadaceae bacterium]
MNAVRLVRALVAWTLVLGIVSCYGPSDYRPADYGPAQKIELSKSGDCPQVKDWQHVFVEGYFGIDPVGINGGYEGQYPNQQFAFSSDPNGKFWAAYEQEGASPEPHARTKLLAAVTMANYGSNGPEIANRTRDSSHGKPDHKWHIYQRREISFDDRVRITGFWIPGTYTCTVTVK